MNNQQQDTFADIAARGINFSNSNLIKPKPPQLKEKYFNLKGIDEKAVFTPLKKMDSKEELYTELEDQRNYYKEFLKDMAPTLKSYRIKTYLRDFDWRVQTEEDKQNFRGVLDGTGSWEQLKVPHYGEPVGKAVTYYRTRFNLSKEQIDKGALFICFKGVDYKANVFVNDSFIGSHEGFFAPFEFDITPYAKNGENTLVVMVENDFICKGNDTPTSKGIEYTGEKIYAATGPGYDDAEFGWHHCPAGMGIYQDVYVEARPRVYVRDIFIRPLMDDCKAEAWIEVYNCDVVPKEVKLKLSLYGQNFEHTIFTDLIYKPTTNLTVGLGDSLTEARVKAEGKLNQSIPLHMEKGTNLLKVQFDISNMRIWEPKMPWLYQLQVNLLDNENRVVDSSKEQFGMRSFYMDENSETKGMFYFNGRKIRLRGANTMGHEQQCVMKKDFNQLIDDILLAKICNMNFLRLTQRPVQPEVYEFCDKLGMMTQTDLPLFGMLRRSQFCEAIRQTEEMERLVRSHPCNIMVTYINEPFPNAGNKPHINLTRNELTDFFTAANLAIRLNNPDRVIKCIDGDYDPPAGGLPDNHCYPGWYNGHGIDLGRLHKGYWMQVKPGWHYGCGEFGSEGLDPVEVMEKYYPKEWLPSYKDENNWSPNSIVGAQTGKFCYMFYDTPDTLEEWVIASHEYQAWATKFMTEAFRRDSRMNTFAIHLFIDAFPSGWMKTIMDVDRQPKPAYFAYRDALTPVLVNIRTDRYKYFAGEEIKLETWVCNDQDEIRRDLILSYQVKKGEEILFAGREQVDLPTCSSKFQGFIKIKAPEVYKRTQLIVQIGLLDQTGNVLHDYGMEIEVFPESKKKYSNNVFVVGSGESKAYHLVKDLGITPISIEDIKEKDIILIDDYHDYKENEEDILQVVSQGATVIFLELSEGEYEIGQSRVKVKSCGMLPLHFVSRNTGHGVVEGFEKNDFRLWYDLEKDYITPILETTFTAEQFKPILTSGNIDSQGNWNKALATAEKSYENGHIVICQVKISGRTLNNPTAKLFIQRLIENKY